MGWLEDVKRVMDSYGVPVRTWLGIAQVESGLNPTIVNQSSGATGLFQIMPFHGVNATDPVASARWSAPRMAAAIQRTGTTDPLTVAINSDWPGNINYLPMGRNDPEVRLWEQRYNSHVKPFIDNPLSDLGSLLSRLTGGGGVDPPEPVQPPVIHVPPVGPPPQPIGNPPASQNPFNGNLVRIPPVDIGPFQDIDLSPVVGLTARFGFSAIALGALMVGVTIIVLEKTPKGVTKIASKVL